MMSLSGDTQADVIEAFNSMSRYFDDLLNISNSYFEGMVSHIYSAESHEQPTKLCKPLWKMTV